jgi:hypothetical protein
VEDTPEPGDGFGSTLTIGDFNNDGWEDLAAGVPGEDFGGLEVAGAVNVIYGSSSGLQTADPTDQFWTQDSPGIEDISEESDRFASSLASGDFNGDGFVDLAVGAPGESGVVSSMGVVHVLYGTSSGLSASIISDQRWTQNSPGINDSAEAGDLFGSTLAAADFNGDGNSDLAVGVPQESVGTVSEAGATNVLYGSDPSITSANDQFWHQNKPDVNDRAEAGDKLGTFATTP